MRVIKRYSNRKLYDVEQSRYVTLKELADHIRSGGEISVVEKNTGTDITKATLAQIVFEETKRGLTVSIVELQRLIRMPLALPIS